MESVNKETGQWSLSQGFRQLLNNFWRKNEVAVSTDAIAQDQISKERSEQYTMEQTATPTRPVTASNKEKLNGLSEIYSFFRKNKKPIYFVSPTAYNVLGLDQWVRHFSYINYFDSFDGKHPRILTPETIEAPEFTSMEDVVNYLLEHPQSKEQIGEEGGLLMTVMFDEKTEQLAREMGLEIALPSYELRNRIDSKIVTTQLANEAGVASAPNCLGQADTYAQLEELARKHNLGNNLVVQTPYGDSGRTTFFIKSEADWDKHAEDIQGQQLKVMKYIRHLPGAVECVATRHGTLVGPMLTDITGFEELTPYKGGWCGNDVRRSLFTSETREKLNSMASALGDRLYKEGYKGTFCLDFLMDLDDGEIYLGEINPRISGVTAPTHLITSNYGGAPLLLFHLLEFMDVDYDVDLDAIQTRWNDYDGWSQLTFKQPDDEVKLIVKAPRSGVYRYENGKAEFVRSATGWHEVADENEFFYLRVYGVGEYSYKGADMGVIVSRQRMQSEGRDLHPEAKEWTEAIRAKFSYTRLPPVYQQTPPPPMANSLYKLF